MSAAPHSVPNSAPNPAPSQEPVQHRRPLSLAMTALAVSTASLAACAAPPPPPPPPPPSPVVVTETVPYRPVPPAGAHYVMDLPPRGSDGRRVTVNSNLSDDQLVWNLRSAWNVAALNCLAPEYEPILASYRAFLTNNVKSLKAVNDRIEKTYTSRFDVKRDAMIERDGYTTRVYNFFAEPAARAGFCRAALDMANRALAEPKIRPLEFASANFGGLLMPFDQFFNEYEAYQQASAAWDDKWGAQFGASQPGWVAVQQARTSDAPVPSGVAAQAVIDPVTGLAVPVIPVTEGVVSQPIIEPIAGQPERASGE